MADDDPTMEVDLEELDLAPVEPGPLEASPAMTSGPPPGPPPPASEPRGSVADLVDENDFVEEALEDRVDRLLVTATEFLANWLGDDDVEDHFVLTDTERSLLTDSATGMALNSERAAELIDRSDTLVFAATLGNYMTRNLKDGRNARRARDAKAAGPDRSDGGDGRGAPVDVDGEARRVVGPVAPASAPPGQAT